MADRPITYAFHAEVRPGDEYPCLIWCLEQDGVLVEQNYHSSSAFSILPDYVDKLLGFLDNGDLIFVRTTASRCYAYLYPRFGDSTLGAYSYVGTSPEDQLSLVQAPDLGPSYPAVASIQYSDLDGETEWNHSTVMLVRQPGPSYQLESNADYSVSQPSSPFPNSFTPTAYETMRFGSPNGFAVVRLSRDGRNCILWPFSFPLWSGNGVPQAYYGVGEQQVIPLPEGRGGDFGFFTPDSRNLLVFDQVNREAHLIHVDMNEDSARAQLVGREDGSTESITGYVTQTYLGSVDISGPTGVMHKAVSSPNGRVVAVSFYNPPEILSENLNDSITRPAENAFDRSDSLVQVNLNGYVGLDFGSDRVVREVYIAYIKQSVFPASADIQAFVSGEWTTVRSVEPDENQNFDSFFLDEGISASAWRFVVRSSAHPNGRSYGYAYLEEVEFRATPNTRQVFAHTVIYQRVGGSLNVLAELPGDFGDRLDWSGDGKWLFDCVAQRCFRHEGAGQFTENADFFSNLSGDTLLRQAASLDNPVPKARQSLYRAGRTAWVDGSLDFDNLKIALLSADAVFNADEPDVSPVLANEIYGSQWPQSGKPFGAAQVRETPVSYSYDYADVAQTVAGPTLEFSYALIYDATNDVPVSFVTFPSPQKVNAGTDYVLEIADTGLLAVSG